MTFWIIIGVMLSLMTLIVIIGLFASTRDYRRKQERSFEEPNIDRFEPPHKKRRPTYTTIPPLK